LDETKKRGYNQLETRRCEELDRKYLSIKEPDKKYLSIILIVIITTMIGYFTYIEYRMLQMDKYMSQACEINDEKGEIIDETDKRTIKGELDEALANADKIIEKQNKMISFEEKAYKYADGPYKELIGLYLKADRLYLESYRSWKNGIEYMKKGDYFLAAENLKKEEELSTKGAIIYNEIHNFLSKHPEIKKHINKYW